jgi:hypothetical protein
MSISTQNRLGLQIKRLTAKVYSSRLKSLPSPIYRTYAISLGFATLSGVENGARCEIYLTISI